ncbi:MAG TPA: pilus assembly protein N-terminal domain-containing protein [Bryobacteraceae bacterium]|nr:pilus assembly protein N-terminal domain-containing protein [Bryobacteraceae bacterium]
MTAIPLKSVAAPAALALLLAFSPVRCLAQSAEDLRMTVGKSIVIDYPADIRQISTSNPDIVDASPVTAREILMHGKGLGSATMVVWSKTGERMFYNVTVELNLDPLRRLLQDSFPGEKLTAASSRDSIALNGTASSKDVGDRAVALAANFGKTVVNNIQVAPGGVERQILLRVKFAELDRQKEQQFGVNLLGMPGLTNIGTTTGQFGPPGFANAIQGNGQEPVSNQTTITQALNIFALNTKLNLGAFIKALQQEAVLEILAEPNLVTSNGMPANFLVGGEFPVPVLQGGANSGAVTIQFREFGIRLTFTPQITVNNTIKLYLKQEVSTTDFTNAVQINGFTIPALSTRRAETNVELAEGQSFVVAGLVDNREQDNFSKIPVLGSLPIFGQLFRSRDEKKSRTELVMLVTPEITMPLSASDPQPQPYFPKDFLVRLDPKDVPQPAKPSKGSSKK